MKEKKREHGGGLELQLATGEKSTFLIPAATGKEKIQSRVRARSFSVGIYVE